MWVSPGQFPSVNEIRVLRCKSAPDHGGGGLMIPRKGALPAGCRASDPPLPAAACRDAADARSKDQMDVPAVR